MRTHGHGRSIERAVTSFSKLGEHGVLWIALSATGAALNRDRRQEFRDAGITVAASFIANQTMKLAIRRRRPTLPGLPPLIDTMSDRSYPSAHATTSAAGARALSPLLPAPPLYAVAAALALSRPYLGVHYPSDTLAGAVLGAAVAELRR
jgi:membrane-associated phospholipid phosphatase